MTNLAKKLPLGQKKPKTKPNKKHLNWVRQQNCCICEKYGELQLSPTQAHHPIHDRHSTRKVSDDLAIPLCEGHHLGMFDNSKCAIHREPLVWRMKYGKDGDYSSSH